MNAILERLGSLDPYDSRPESQQITNLLRAAIKNDVLHAGQQLPSQPALARHFNVARETVKTALRALVMERLIVSRQGSGTYVLPAELRATEWPMTGRYARARAAQGLIFAADVTGAVRKDTVWRGWVKAPILVAQFLNIAVGSRVFQRCSRTYVSDAITENTSMFFPEDIVRVAPRLESEERIRVVPFIEDSGHVVTRTMNQIRARHATTPEKDLFGIESTDIVIEHFHGTYGAGGEALEAVLNVRPAHDTVITFETYEAPITTE